MYQRDNGGYFGEALLGCGFVSAEEFEWGFASHLCILNVPYVEGMRACIAKSRRQGRLSYGPYRHPWFGRWFTNTMEPPPKRRMPTTKGMVPDPDLDGSEVGPKFARIQDDLSQLMDDAWGVDLGKARFSSPFLRVVRLSLGTGLSLLLAHNRRHVWLAREVMDWDGFP